MNIFSKRFNFLGWSIVLSGLLLTACQVSSQKNSPEVVIPTQSSPETVAQTENSPETVVQTLYRNFSGDNLIIDEDKETLSNYFTPELVNLILQDRACAEQAQGICNLDFDILYNTQDPQISELQVGTFDSAQQTITVTFKNSDTPQTVVYQMENTPTGWRAADIRYSAEESLRNILSSQ